jgi:hypothetical protein
MADVGGLTLPVVGVVVDDEALRAVSERDSGEIFLPLDHLQVGDRFGSGRGIVA